MEVQWTNETVISLMEEYKRRPQLWDGEHELYRVQTAKYEAWCALAARFRCDVADLRKKLNSVFASHRREKAKVRAGGTSSWFLYSYMNFLPRHLTNTTDALYLTSHRVKKNKKLDKQNVDDEESDRAFYLESNYEDNEEDEEPEPVIPAVSVKKEPRPNERKKAREQKRRLVPPKPKSQDTAYNQLDNRLMETLRLLRRSEAIKKKDECDSFGEYIAIALRKHDERTQAMIKQAINNIIFEQEMKKYNNSNYVVISSIEENPLMLPEHDPPDDDHK